MLGDRKHKTRWIEISLDHLIVFGHLDERLDELLTKELDAKDLTEAYRNFGKRFDWSLAIKRHDIVMAAPTVETI